MIAPSIYVVFGRERELIGWSFDKVEAEAFCAAKVAIWTDEFAAGVEECQPVELVRVPCVSSERDVLLAEIQELKRQVAMERHSYLTTHESLCSRNGEITELKREQAALINALGQKEP